MNERIYVLEGNPISLASTTFARETINLYDSQKRERIHTALLLECLHGNSPLYTKAIAVDATFFLPIPKNRSKENKSLLERTYHSNRPLAVDLIRWLEDIGRGVVWRDTGIIASLSIRKLYSCDPKTIFTVREL